MNVVVVNASGSVGRLLAENLKLVRDKKLRSRAALAIDEIIECALDDLAGCASLADVVVDLTAAGEGLSCAASHLTDILRNVKANAALLRLCGGDVAEAFAADAQKFARETGAAAYVLRLPEVFGMWEGSDDASSVSALCAAAAAGAELVIRDPDERRELLYTGDLVEEIMDVLEGRLRPDADSALCPITAVCSVSMGEIAGLLTAFVAQQNEQRMPEVVAGTFEYKLFSTFLSFLPAEKFRYTLKQRVTDGGKQYRFMTTRKAGQFTINRYAPGTTLGQHWHNTKWEQYTVISGRGLVRERMVGCEEVAEFEVGGGEIQTVQMIPGYAHSITNISDTDDLVILIWSSEEFDPRRPDMNDERV